MNGPAYRPLQACFSGDYYVETRSRSMAKLPEVAWEVESQLLAELVDPGLVDPQLLRRLHDPRYVDAFMSGRGRLASSQNFTWSPGLRQAVLAMQAGQLVGAELALAEGVAANIAQGFHHARFHRGGGYCTFNGLALVAQQRPDLKVAVLDCDEHGGNGTEEFTHRLDNFYNVTIHGTPFGCRGAERSVCFRLEPLNGRFEPYRLALQAAAEQLIAWQPDLLIYQAGVDCHLGDPLSTLGLSAEELQARDRFVFRFAAAQRLPILFLMAGGYQDLAATMALHVNTFHAANEVFRPIAVKTGRDLRAGAEG